MLDLLETLEALDKHGTMSSAAINLRITQSAVSKRISQLEELLNTKLLIRKGRYVLLTSLAKDIVHKSHSFKGEINHLVNAGSSKQQSVHCGCSESILSSWGASAVGKMLQNFPNVKVVPYAHRSPVIIQKVISGNFMVGIYSGLAPKKQDAISFAIGQEPMVILAANQSQLPMISIEEKSETWQSIVQQVKKEKIQVDLQLQSFFSIAQLANQNQARALIPIGVAQALHIPEFMITRTNISRPIWLICKKNFYNQSFGKSVIKNLEQTLRGELGKLL